MKVRKGDESCPVPLKPMKTLVIDVGGTNIKIRATGQEDAAKIASGTSMTAEGMVLPSSLWLRPGIMRSYRSAIQARWLMASRSASRTIWARAGSIVTTRSDSAGPCGCSTTLPCKPLAAIRVGECFSWSGDWFRLCHGRRQNRVATGLAHLPYRKGRTFEDYVGLRGFEASARRNGVGLSATSFAAESGYGCRLRRAGRRQRKTASLSSHRCSPGRQSQCVPRWLAIMGRPSLRRIALAPVIHTGFIRTINLSRR